MGDDSVCMEQVCQLDVGCTGLDVRSFWGRVGAGEGGRGGSALDGRGQMQLQQHCVEELLIQPTDSRGSICQ
jgi:hypothetical protein